ncbi:MAG: hypothetical protein ABI887_21750 [Burkholderiales bacterium]
MGSLFRPEVVTHRQRDWLGSIQLIRPVSLSLLTGFVVLVAVSVALFLTLGEYTRRVRISGYLVLATSPTSVGAELQAYLFAPSGTIGAVRESQAVQLRYQAFPYQTFGQQKGAVAQVSRVPAQAIELAALPASVSAGGVPLFRIVVTLDQQSLAAYGTPQPLAPGMQLEADVALERHRLIEWLFAPLFNAARRV